jgi:hypothetical protein
MKFSEIANRLTGISTPLGGVSWQSSDLEVSAARRVIAFLEDRRVLYAPEEMESRLSLRPFGSGNPAVPTENFCRSPKCHAAGTPLQSAAFPSHETKPSGLGIRM